MDYTIESGRCYTYYLSHAKLRRHIKFRLILKLLTVLNSIGGVGILQRQFGKLEPRALI